MPPPHPTQPNPFALWSKAIGCKGVFALALPTTKLYRDSAGTIREAVETDGVGDGSGAATTPAITQTFGLASADDGLNATVVSASPLMLLSADGYNARNGGVRLMLYDQTTVPKISDTPKWSVYFPGLVSGGREWPTGLQFTKGLAFMLVPDDSTGLMEGDIVGLNLGYAA